jgi:hypothetical protein
MSDQIIASELLAVLSDQQQELLVGSADFNLSNTNFAERVVFSLESTVSSPLDQDRFSLNLDKVISTAAQDFLGFGGAIPTNISALPPPSIY